MSWIIKDFEKATGLAPLLLIYMATTFFFARKKSMLESFLNYWATIAWAFSMVLLGFRLFEICLDMAHDIASAIAS